MGAIRQVLQKQVNQSEMDRIYSCSGRILDYDHKAGTCTVRFMHPASERDTVAYKVPVSNSGTIVSAGNIKPGSICQLSFMNGFVTAPSITSILETDYQNRTNAETGAFFTDSECHTAEKPSEVSPMVNDWIDDKNTDPNKYDNDFGGYKDADLEQHVTDIMSYTDRLSPDESGIITPGGTVRIKDTGEMDIFAGFNTGLKIGTDGSLRFYGGTESDKIKYPIYWNDHPIEDLISNTVINKYYAESKKEEEEEKKYMVHYNWKYYDVTDQTPKEFKENEEIPMVNQIHASIENAIKSNEQNDEYKGWTLIGWTSAKWSPVVQYQINSKRKPKTLPVDVSSNIMLYAVMEARSKLSVDITYDNNGNLSNGEEWVTATLSGGKSYVGAAVTKTLSSLNGITYPTNDPNIFRVKYTSKCKDVLTASASEQYYSEPLTATIDVEIRDEITIILRQSYNGITKEKTFEHIPRSEPYSLENNMFTEIAREIPLWHASKFIGWSTSETSTSPSISSEHDTIIPYTYCPGEDVLTLYGIIDTLSPVTINITYSHKHATGDCGMLVDNSGNYSLSGKETALVEIIGGESSLGLPVTINFNHAKGTITGNDDNRHYELEFNKTTVTRVTAEASDGYCNNTGENKIRINTYMDGDGAFTDNNTYVRSEFMYPAGDGFTTVMPDTYVCSVSFSCSIPGHAGFGDYMYIIGKNASGDEYLLWNGFKNDSVKTFDPPIPFDGIYNEGNSVDTGDLQQPINSGTVTLKKEWDIKQVKFYASTKHVNSSCMDQGALNFSVDYEPLDED